MDIDTIENGRTPDTQEKMVNFDTKINQKCVSKSWEDQHTNSE